MNLKWFETKGHRPRNVAFVASQWEVLNMWDFCHRVEFSPGRTRKGRKRRGSRSSEEGGGVSLKSQPSPYPSLCPIVSHCQDPPPPLYKNGESFPNHRLWGDLMSVKRPRYVDRCLLWLCLLCAVCFPPPASPDDKCLGGGIAACEVFLWARRL